ncbi:hypothetical protein HZA45_02280 [Candidatus Peregrinibacteria bacterium]|nr:hypothetical protein [Candidatus Peregrinibacteria bacterium]
MRFTYLALALLLAPATAAAQAFFIPACPAGGLLPCGGGGVLGATVYLTAVIFPAVRLGFIAVAIIMFTIYAGQLLLNPTEESTVKDMKEAYADAVVGAVIVSVSTFIVDAFGRGANNTLINPLPVTFAITNVLGYFKLVMGVLISVLVTTQGIRLMLLQGQESEITQQRSRFLYSLLGVAVILLANAIIAVIQPGANSIIASNELRGIVNFGLVFLAVLAVISIAVAGIFLIVSVDETFKDKAKNIIFGTVVSLIIVMSAYSIVNYFLFL